MANHDRYGSEASVPELRIKRMEPPDMLADDEKVEWRKIVEAQPADWFNDGNAALLTQLCRHIIAARVLGEMMDRIRKQKHPDHKEYMKLVSQQRSESGTICRLMSAMYLTQQSAMSTSTTSQKLKRSDAADPDREMLQAAE